MSDNKYLSLRELISESLIRDVVLFLFLFLVVIAQDWDNIFLLLFPLISFSFALFFKIVATAKKRINDNLQIIYNPLGSELVYAHRLNFCALLQLVLLFWLGAESLYHPQLIDTYYIYFISLFIFFYTFGFSWIFFDLWRYSKIEIITEDLETNTSQISHENFENVISFLKMKDFKMISIINFLVFVILNLMNIMFAYYDVMPGIKYNLPGTGIEESDPINLSYVIYGIICIPPLISVAIMRYNYKNLNNINKQNLDKVLNNLPKSVQAKVTKNLVALNKKFKNKVSLE